MFEIYVESVRAYLKNVFRLLLSRKPKHKVSCIAFFVLSFCGNALQAQAFRIEGEVIDNTDTFLSGVEIALQIPGQVIITDSLGRFVFYVSQGGHYVISTFAEGYQRFEKMYTIKAETLQIRIVLHPLIKELQEVIIKDRHEEKRRQTESLNIDIVNQKYIQRHLGGSLMQTLSRMPGVKTIGIGSGQSKPLIRGLGFNRVVVVDKGVKHEGQQWGADHGLEIDQFAASEVELIKGAASFVYGSDAIGGAIDIKPSPLPPLHIMGGAIDIVGKSNNHLLGTSANLFARNQKLFFDARFTYQNYGDYRVPTDRLYVYDYEVDLHKNFLRNTAGRETGLHLNTGFIADKWRSVFYLSNINSQSGFFANAHGLEPRRVDEVLHDASARDILLPKQQVNHFKIINRTSYKSGLHRWEAELGYQRNVREEFSQYVNHGYMPPLYPDTLGIADNLERAFDKHVFSVNIKDQVSLGKHSLAIGVNGEYQDNTISGWTFLVPAFRQRGLGTFAYDKYALNERLLLHGAVRYDYGRICMFEYRDWFASVDAGSDDKNYLLRANNVSRIFHSLVWSAGINYNQERFELKANVGKSFRMPIAKELGANGVNYHYFSYEQGDATLSAEQSYQADMSVSWNARKWFIKLSPFYNYFPNYIYLNPTAGHDYFYGAGNQIFEYTQSRVMRYGAELEFTYRILTTLSAGLLVEYLYAEQLSGSKKGYTLPFSPPASGLINLTWSPLMNKGNADTYISVDYRVTAPQNSIVPPEKKTSGYQVVNLQAGTRIKLWKQPLQISLQVQNLFNVRYLNHTSFYRLIELPEAGRNIILSVKLPFQTHLKK